MKETPYPKEFLAKQKDLLIALRAAIMDGVQKPDAKSDTADHVDAAADATDFDFALGILASEKNAMLEIQHALKRIEDGTYGICEVSGQKIPEPRLEAMPFTRYTVVVQSNIEKDSKYAKKQSYAPLFDDHDDGEEVEHDHDEPDGPEIV